MDSPISLVTQPMLQVRPNRTGLRSIDSYIQILCNVCFKKTVTIHSIVSVLWIVTVFLEQTLDSKKRKVPFQNLPWRTKGKFKI